MLAGTKAGGVKRRGRKIKPRTAEQNKALGAALKRAWADDNKRTKLLANIAKAQDAWKSGNCEAGRLAISEKAKARWADPDYRAKMIHVLAALSQGNVGRKVGPDERARRTLSIRNAKAAKKCSGQ